MLCGFACCLVVCLSCVFLPVLLYQPETPCLLVPPSSLPTKPGADNLSLILACFMPLHSNCTPYCFLLWPSPHSSACMVWSPTGTDIQTIYLWRHSSLPLFGVVSRLCTTNPPPPPPPLNLCFNKYLFHSLCIWVPSC